MRYVSAIETPIGKLVIVSDGKNIKNVFIGDETPFPDVLTEKTAREIEEYFLGTRQVFDVPCLPDGSDFDKSVWCELEKIPFGQTGTYGGIAASLGKPGASRAVGGAVGRNPALIIIPCHRVTAKNGLGGFSAGIEKKKKLLETEKIKL